MAPRKFDREAASSLRASGKTYRQIGALLGVSGTAVRQALVPSAYESHLKRKKAAYRARVLRRA